MGLAVPSACTDSCSGGSCAVGTDLLERNRRGLAARLPGVTLVGRVLLDTDVTTRDPRVEPRL